MMQMKSVTGILLAVIMLMTIAACSGRLVGERPVFVKQDAHGGGSVVAFSPSGEWLASGGWEGRVRLWQTADGAGARSWPAHTGSVNGISFVEANGRLVTAGFDGLLASWSLEGRLLGSIDTRAPIMHMTANESAGRLLTGHKDGSIRLWRLADFTLLDERRLHRGAVKAVAIDSSGGRYASSGADGAVYLWSEHVPARRLADPPTDAWTLAFSPNNRWLMGGGWFRLFRWNLREASLQTLPTPHRGIIRSIKFLAAGAELASISRQTDSAVYFLDPQTGEALRRFQQHDLCGADIAVSPNGRFLATTSDDASVRIWDLAGGVDQARRNNLVRA